MATGSVVFLFDENSPQRLARSLRELGESAYHVYDVLYPGTGLCQIARTVIRNWPEMKRIGKTTDRPFLYLVSENSVKPMRRKKLG